MAPTSPGRRGSVRQDDNSTWSYTVDLTLPASQRRQTRKRGFLTRKVAQAALTETLAKLQDQSYVPPSRLALRTFIEDTWLPAVAGELRPSTLNSYSRNLRLHVLPALGSAPLQSLDASTLTQHYQRLVAGGRRTTAPGRDCPPPPSGTSTPSCAVLYRLPTNGTSSPATSPTAPSHPSHGPAATGTSRSTPGPPQPSPASSTAPRVNASTRCGCSWPPPACGAARRLA